MFTHWSKQLVQYFRSCAMSSVSRYFFMSPCMLSLHLFLGRPRLLLPETSSLSDFAQMWLGSRLKQWPNHFSLLFSRKVSTGFTWASFLMSSFLMWSNLVFPLAHLNILISAVHVGSHNQIKYLSFSVLELHVLLIGIWIKSDCIAAELVHDMTTIPMIPWNQTTAVVNKCKLKLFTVRTIKFQSHTLDNLKPYPFPWQHQWSGRLVSHLPGQWTPEYRVTTG